MEYLQYNLKDIFGEESISFKPYYKWNTFNTQIINTLHLDMPMF